MDTFYLTMDLAFTSPAEVTDEDFDAFTDRVMDELDKLDVIDPDISGSLTERTMAITMAVRTTDLVDALWEFTGAVRTALHVAGCGTQNWPTFKLLEASTRVLDLASS